MPSKKKKYNARFPAGRIKKIMQTDEEVGKVAQAVPIIISRTLELFVESLIKKSMKVTLMKNAKTLSPYHMKQCILSESRFDFLKDLVKSVPEVAVSDEDNWNVTDSSTNSSFAQRRDSCDEPLESKTGGKVKIEEKMDVFEPESAVGPKFYVEAQQASEDVGQDSNEPHSSTITNSNGKNQPTKQIIDNLNNSFSDDSDVLIVSEDETEKNC